MNYLVYLPYAAVTACAFGLWQSNGAAGVFVFFLLLTLCVMVHFR